MIAVTIIMALSALALLKEGHLILGLANLALAIYMLV